jgi:hypothetical protein
MANAMKVITIDHTRSIDPGDIVHVMPHRRDERQSAQPHWHLSDDVPSEKILSLAHFCHRSNVAHRLHNCKGLASKSHRAIGLSVKPFFSLPLNQSCLVKISNQTEFMDSIDATRQSAMMSQAGRCEADGQRARR